MAASDVAARPPEAIDARMGSFPHLFFFQNIGFGGFRLFCQEAIGKQECGVGRREFLNIFELPTDSTRPDFRFFDCLGRLIEFLLQGILNLAVLCPFSFYTGKEIPHVTGTFLDCQRPEAHLEAIQDRPKRSRASNNHAVVALDSLNQASSTNCLCKETFNREIEDSKVSGIRRSEILLADVPST